MGKYTVEVNWVGSQVSYVDEPTVDQLSHIVVGRFGGNSTAGQYKNEDGCLVWFGEKEDWEFAILLDAHNSADSAELIVEAFTKKKKRSPNSVYLTSL